MSGSPEGEETSGEAAQESSPSTHGHHHSALTGARHCSKCSTWSTPQPRQQPSSVGPMIHLLQMKDPDTERVACRRLHSEGGAAGGSELELEKGASSCVQKWRDGFWGHGVRVGIRAMPFICFALLPLSFSTRKMGMKIVTTSWCYGWIKCVDVREGLGP